MQVKQIYTLMNSVTQEILGKTDLVQEDLQNVVDLGKEILDATSVDNYVKTLIDQIGKVVFVNRPYSGKAPSVLMDSWEFGSVVEKVQAEIPEATENESWNLVDGHSYDPNIFYKPEVTVKFFNSKVTFEVPVSITEMQVKESFQSANQLNSFISMIYNTVDKSMTIKTDALIMRTINNMIGETVYDEYPTSEYSASSGVRAVNLLYKYNQKTGAGLTADKCLDDSSFLKFASKEISLYIERLGSISDIFNVGGKSRFTPKDLLHVVMLSDFTSSTDSYLQADTYHNELTKLPNHEVVPYWQGSGQKYDFKDTSKINIITSDNHSVELGGILCVLFDRDALGVTNYNRRVTTNYNPKAEFLNSWYKMDSGYFNDLNENFVVFFVA